MCSWCAFYLLVSSRILYHRPRCGGQQSWWMLCSSGLLPSSQFVFATPFFLFTVTHLNRHTQNNKQRLTILNFFVFRAWHEENGGSLWNMSSRLFFSIVALLSSILQLIQSFAFPSVSSLSSLCWIWNESTTAQQIGSGQLGLGLFSVSLDWSSIIKFTGDPLALPRGVILNVMAGHYFFTFVVIPLVYWYNGFETKNFPMLSPELFDKYGNIYNVSRVLNSDGMTFNETAYREYSPVYLSALTVASYSAMYASIFISLVHVILKW